MLFVVSLLKAYAEILVLALAGRGLLRLVLRQRAEQNLVYRICAGITRPAMRLARWLAPRFVPDRLVWIVVLVLVLAFWITASTYKTGLCTGDALNQPTCQEVRRALIH